MSETGKQPDKKFSVGGVSAAIWKRENTAKDDRRFTTYKIAIDRAYKDSNDKWRNTRQFDANDLQKVLLVVQRAQEYVLDKPKDSDNTEPETVVEEEN